MTGYSWQPHQGVHQPKHPTTTATTTTWITTWVNNNSGSGSGSGDHPQIKSTITHQDEQLLQQQTPSISDRICDDYRLKDCNHSNTPTFSNNNINNNNISNKSELNVLCLLSRSYRSISSTIAATIHNNNNNDETVKKSRSDDSCYKNFIINDDDKKFIKNNCCSTTNSRWHFWLLLSIILLLLLIPACTANSDNNDNDELSNPPLTNTNNNNNNENMSELNKRSSDDFLDLGNSFEKRLEAVFAKVAYGITTKRSIPDNAYPVTTLATPLLTTYRYTDGNNEWGRVDLKNNNNNNNNNNPPPSQFDLEPNEYDDVNSRRLDDLSSGNGGNGYGADLEKDHALPTSAPAADILKNNNNKHYNNPNRYNNDRLKPSYDDNPAEQVTETVFKTTTGHNSLRNVRPTKSMYSKDIPSYVPPSRGILFTPPLPPEYQNPFADKPTLRGTNSDGLASRRPLPPPSLMPNKDRIPYRPDLPKVNMERDRIPERPNNNNNNNNNEAAAVPPPARPPSSNSALDKTENRKKTLNTPSQNVRLGEFYGLNRSLNETNYEYEKSYAPDPPITRILSGSNGRHDDIRIPDILYQTVTAIPNLAKNEAKSTKVRAPAAEPSLKIDVPPVKGVVISDDLDDGDDPDDEELGGATEENGGIRKKEVPPIPLDRSESVTVKKDFERKQPALVPQPPLPEDVTTQISDMVNMPNVKEKEANVTKVGSEQIWLVCWNVHVYLVVFGYIILAVYSIYKLIRYENDPHMFSKSYFLTIHLMLTVICVLRIFYLTYDAYNVNKSFNIFLYDLLHSFPLSLLATTFAVLILFLLKRTLTHLEVKTRPVFLVVFALLHIVLCFSLSIFENFGHLEKASLIVCRPVFVLLVWALGCSYLYLYRIIKNVLAKKSQNLSEMCTQNISYASHITIAVALLFILLGFVQLYALFFIKIDKFNGEIKHHWILWGFELSVRFLEITIITLLAVVVSLKMSQREKQTPGGFPLFPCTTSDSSTDNIYPNNCNTNPNALNYSRNEMIMENILPTEPVERPNLLKNAFQNDSFDKKSTLERYQSDPEPQFDRFERPNWQNGSDRFDPRHPDQSSLNNFVGNTAQPQSAHFERRNERNSAKKSSSSTSTSSSSQQQQQQQQQSSSSKYYTKPKYDLEYNNDDYQHDLFSNHHHNQQQQQQERNIYSEPVDHSNHQYEMTRHDFERNDFDRRSKNSITNTSGRRSTGRSSRNNKNHPIRAHHLGGIQTLPNHQHQFSGNSTSSGQSGGGGSIGDGGGGGGGGSVMRGGGVDTMLVRDEQGFVRFRHIKDDMMLMQHSSNEKQPPLKKYNKKTNEVSHYSDS